MRKPAATSEAFAVAERLRWFVKTHFGSVFAFAVATGIDPSSLQRYIGAQVTPGLDKLMMMLDKGDLSIDWLITGEGCPKRHYHGACCGMVTPCPHGRAHEPSVEIVPVPEQ